MTEFVKLIRENPDRFEKVLIHDITSTIPLEKNCIVLFNGSFADNCIRANAIEKWIEIAAINTPNVNDTNYCFKDHYGKPIRVKVSGHVDIFKITPTGELIQKNMKESGSPSVE